MGYEYFFRGLSIHVILGYKIIQVFTRVFSHSVSFFVHISMVILEKKIIFYITFWFCIVAHVLSHKSLFYVMS
jgi:hypothetical protein